MKKTYLLIVAISFFLIIGACSNELTSSEIPISVVKGSVQLSSTFNEMFESATDIVEVSVLKHDGITVSDDVPFTDSIIEIKDVLKGNLNIGEQILVTELGGVYYPLLFGDKELGHSDKQVDIAFEGVRVIQPDEEYILFISKNPNMSNDSYYVHGINQGKYKIKDSKIEIADHHGQAKENNQYKFEFENVYELKEEIRKLNKSRK